MNTYLMRRFLSTASSNRLAFRRLEPDRRVLDFLDKTGLGRPHEKGTRQIVALKRRQYGLGQHAGSKSPSSFPLVTHEESPHPFNRGPKSVTRIHQIYNIDYIPDYGTMPEVAVMGRSNVGKSTLLNAVLGFDSHVQKAAVSSKPGETKNLQFFCIGSYNNKKSAPKIAVVDMPGYGFAFMSPEAAATISKLTIDYVCDRGPNLKRILLILDARHGFKKTDIDYMTQLMDQVKQRGQRPSWKMQVVLTKCDLVSRHDVARRVIAVQEQMREQLPGVALSNLPIVMVSGHERRGIVQLQRELASLVPPPRPVPLNVTPASPVDTKGGAAAVKTTVSTKNAKKIKELSGKTKKSPAVKNQPEKKSTKSVPEKTNIATEIVEDTESRMQPAQKDATKDQAGLDMRNAKIAPMLRKVTKISKPTMHEYEAAAAAPPAPDSVISLTMSDRLDAILGHYLDRIADGTVIDDNKGTAKDVVSTVASSGLDINNGSNSNNEQVCSDPISPQVSTPINGYYERIGRNFKKNGKIELNFGEDGEKVKNGRKEKKNMYRTRFSRKDKN